ncbi:MAG: hypothetical protein Q9160_006205 [Pyrenula sp. 1 TL-2023]
MPSNAAAYLMGSKGLPLEVKSAPYTTPCENEIVVKNRAVAINPADWLKQGLGNFMYSWVKYPFVLGTDLAGEVVEIGSNVTRFRIGDRVVGNGIGVDPKRNSAAEGAFQTYTILLQHMAAQIPDAMSFEAAAVLPLGLSTAACGLYEKEQLALPLPSAQPKPTGKALLIWGGSTSVGCNAIQLGVASGYEVITTASPKNFEYLKRLGASHVFDYNSQTVVEDIIRACRDKTFGGALSIGAGGADACSDVLAKCNGNQHIAMVTYPVPQRPPPRFGLVITIYSFLSWSIYNWFRSKARRQTTKFIFGSSLAFNEVGKAVYENFLPEALARGAFVPAPEPHVYGKGLENIQAAMDFQKAGVSAKKVVVSFE